MCDTFNIQDLVKLFNPAKNDSESDLDDDEEQINKKSLNLSSNINQNDIIKSNEHDCDKINPYTKIDNRSDLDDDIQKTIDGDHDGAAASHVNSDWKQCPQFNISYRQRVDASDVFFQMSAKNPSTASCENMIVCVHLPGEHMQNIDIKLLKDKIEVVSPRFYLNLPLPQPVNPKLGDAKWEKNEEKLIVTLLMDREFDFINF